MLFVLGKKIRFIVLRIRGFLLCLIMKKRLNVRLKLWLIFRDLCNVLLGKMLVLIMIFLVLRRVVMFEEYIVCFLL